MRTFVHNGDGPTARVVVHHYSDLDGDLRLMVSATAVREHQPASDGHPAIMQITVPGHAVRDLVLQWLRRVQISALEEADPETLIDRFTR